MKPEFTRNAGYQKALPTYVATVRKQLITHFKKKDPDGYVSKTVSHVVGELPTRLENLFPLPAKDDPDFIPYLPLYCTSVAEAMVARFGMLAPATCLVSLTIPTIGTMETGGFDDIIPRGIILLLWPVVIVPITRHPTRTGTYSRFSK